MLSVELPDGAENKLRTALGDNLLVSATLIAALYVALEKLNYVAVGFRAHFHPVQVPILSKYTFFPSIGRCSPVPW